MKLHDQQHFPDLEASLARATEEARELVQRLSAALENQMRAREEHRLDDDAEPPPDSRLRTRGVS